jgi:glucose/arabinose dehydrogenase
VRLEGQSSAKSSPTPRAAALVVALAALASALAPRPARAELPADLEAEVLVDGLSFPVSMAPTPDGDILVTEKFGDVRLVRDGAVVDEPLASFRVITRNEAGLLGVTLTPDFARTGEFLVLQTPQSDPDLIFVSRLRLDGDRAEIVDERWLELPSIENTDRHYSGNAAYGPDGHLFITLGDLRRRSLSQNTDSLNGSVLRYAPDGSIPDDNPWGADSALWAIGLRNPFDIDVGPDGDVYIIENGADVADEVDHIEAGRNYGWPSVQGYCDNFPEQEPCTSDTDFADPAHEYRNIAGPTGVVVYDGALLERYAGDVFVTGWHSGQLDRFTPEEDGALTLVEHLFAAPGDSGLVDVEVAHDGALLVMESGRDVGRIYRIAPVDDPGPDDGEDPEDPPADGSDSDASEGSCAHHRDALPADPLAPLLALAAAALALARRRDSTR